MLVIINYRLPTCLYGAASAEAAGGVKASPRGPLSRLPARVALHRGCVIRHLVNRSEMPASGSHSYALLFLVHYSRHARKFLSCHCRPVHASVHCSGVNPALTVLAFL